MVRFRPTQAGVYTIQVDAVSIDGVAQDFAYAVAEGLAVAPIAAIYESFGQGCAGSGSTGVDGPACAGPNRNAATFAYEGMAEQHEFAMQEISPPGQPTVIGGISMLLAARPGPAVSVTFGIRLAGTDFRPAEPPVATTTVVVGSTPGWWGANFARPVTIPPSTRYFVTIESGPLASFAPVPAAPSREGRALFSRSRCSTWGSPSTVVTSYRVHCASPSASVAIPLLSANGLPSPGGQMAVELAHARPGAAAVLLTGFSNSAWGAASLPFDLGGLGAPGCQLLVAPEVADGLVAGSAGTASRAFALPNQPGLLGGQFYQQYAVLDPVNPLGLVTSNGGQARVGR
jgi:hypothetical protein